MLKISNSITINDIKGSSRRYYRLEKIDIPKTVLKNFCLFYFNSTIENNLIIFHDKKPKFHSETKHHHLSNTDKVFLQIFSDYGPIISFEDLIDFGKIQGLGEPSIIAFFQWSPIVKKIDKGFYILNKKIKELDDNMKIYSQIDLKNSYLDKTECPAIPNKSTYLEVLNDGKLIKTLPYTRPVRKLPDGTEGAVYRKKVYPIIRQYSETETGEREEL